ncbi:hypothetical protein KSP39_PZI008814 [Platanthera zijinensis]|uniref:Uncharacterized protein n=1 Tax=Platanthera zijinensis TaxID=2320716 RepID=A0AAP0BJU9_9ASPA
MSLKERGIKAQHLGSSQTDQSAHSQAENGVFDVLYMTPEKASILPSSFWSNLLNSGFACWLLMKHIAYQSGVMISGVFADTFWCPPTPPLPEWPQTRSSVLGHLPFGSGRVHVLVSADTSPPGVVADTLCCPPIPPLQEWSRTHSGVRADLSSRCGRRHVISASTFWCPRAPPLWKWSPTCSGVRGHLPFGSDREHVLVSEIISRWSGRRHILVSADTSPGGGRGHVPVSVDTSPLGVVVDKFWCLWIPTLLD